VASPQTPASILDASKKALIVQEPMFEQKIFQF
jgi:hypothetical protein